MYQRNEIATLIGCSSRTLQRIIIRNNLKILPKKRLSIKDIKLIQSKLDIDILKKLKL